MTSNSPASPPTPSDIDLIMRTSRDYVEGWYTADAGRMRRCLHPELVKRTVRYDSESSTWLLNRPSSAEMLIGFTQAGGGAETPTTPQDFEITIQHVFRHIACVRVLSPGFVDYLHLAKLDDRWLIVNVLWELRTGGVSLDS